MGLVQVVAGMVRLQNLKVWRGVFDFDAPDLTVGERLARLEYAARQALHRQCDPADRAELEFALEECRALLRLGSLEGEGAEHHRVPQRLERIRRVVGHHEGQMSRLNRRYWWLPFSLTLMLMLVCCLRSLLAL